MSAPDLDTEREVDLARWRRALVALWWLPVAGLVLGAIAGVLYSFSGGTAYKASALISLGQPTAPSGAVVNAFGTNPRAIQEIVSSASAQAEAAKRADMRSGAALRGHVSIAQVGSTSSARETPLISLTVRGKRSSTTAAAANALAKIVVEKTTAPYVGVKIRTFNQTLQSVNNQLTAVRQRIAVIQKAEQTSTKLDPLQQLVIISNEDNAEARLGGLISQQETLQQQLAFATQVESAEIVTQAKAVKASAHSRSTSLVVGALIGLLIGAFVAIAGESRLRRPAAV